MIGELAGLPSGSVAATIGALGGGTVGISADLIHENDQAELVANISRELAPGKAGIVAEVVDEGAIAVETREKALGGTVVA